MRQRTGLLVIACGGAVGMLGVVLGGMLSVPLGVTLVLIGGFTAAIPPVAGNKDYGQTPLIGRRRDVPS